MIAVLLALTVRVLPYMVPIGLGVIVGGIGALLYYSSEQSSCAVCVKPQAAGPATVRKAVR